MNRWKIRVLLTLITLKNQLEKAELFLIEPHLELLDTLIKKYTIEYDKNDIDSYKKDLYEFNNILIKKDSMSYRIIGDLHKDISEQDKKDFFVIYSNYKYLSDRCERTLKDDIFVLDKTFQYIEALIDNIFYVD